MSHLFFGHKKNLFKLQLFSFLHVLDQWRWFVRKFHRSDLLLPVHSAYPRLCLWWCPDNTKVSSLNTIWLLICLTLSCPGPRRRSVWQLIMTRVWLWPGSILRTRGRGWGTDTASTSPGSREYHISYHIPSLQIMFRKVLEYFLHLTSYLHQAPPTRSLAIHTQVTLSANR